MPLRLRCTKICRRSLADQTRLSQTRCGTCRRGDLCLSGQHWAKMTSRRPNVASRPRVQRWLVAAGRLSITWSARHSIPGLIGRKTAYGRGRTPRHNLQLWAGIPVTGTVPGPRPRYTRRLEKKQMDIERGRLPLVNGSWLIPNTLWCDGCGLTFLSPLTGIEVHGNHSASDHTSGTEPLLDNSQPGKHVLPRRWKRA